MRRMMILLLTLASIVPTLAAQDRGPATPEEKAMAVKLARLLESDPLGRDAKDARQWFTVWLVAVPDISVTLCSDLLGPVPRSAKKYAAELTVQTAYSGAAFIIENPAKATDQVAVFQAGLEGALRTYESIRKQQPKFTWPALDDLLAKEQRGELQTYVSDAAAKCAAGK